MKHDGIFGIIQQKRATKGDIDILRGRHETKQDRIKMADKYLQLKAEKEKEEQRKYPNTEYIARCERVMANLLPVYQQVYGN